MLNGDLGKMSNPHPILWVAQNLCMIKIYKLDITISRDPGKIHNLQPQLMNLVEVCLIRFTLLHPPQLPDLQTQGVDLQIHLLELMDLCLIHFTLLHPPQLLDLVVL